MAKKKLLHIIPKAFIFSTPGLDVQQFFCQLHYGLD
jgi:hypothetical protein